MKYVAIIGTVGVPANYGGFETLVENIIGENASKDVSYTIFCSGKSYAERSNFYKGALLKYIPLEANGIQSIFYDMLSLIKATRKSDVILILGVSGCVFLPIYRLFSKKKLIINIDGLEHRRDKWGKWTRRFLKFSEKMAIKHSDVVVTDNKGIQDYVTEEYGKESVLIEYGGDHVICDVGEEEKEVLERFCLKKETYSLALCRIEPENNVEMILKAFSESNEILAFIGNWHNSEFGERMQKVYGGSANIRLLAPIYDLKVLNVLRSDCKYYLHGHSAGGTNPSLVEAMYFGKPIFAFDVVYNRETTEGEARYFKNEQEFLALINEKDEEDCQRNGKAMMEIAGRRYRWSVIANKYEQLY